MLKFDSFAKCKQKKFESKKLINSIVVLTSALGSKVPWVAFGLDNASKQIKMNFSNSKFIKTISKRFQNDFKLNFSMAAGSWLKTSRVSK